MQISSVSPQVAVYQNQNASQAPSKVLADSQQAPDTVHLSAAAQAHASAHDADGDGDGK